MTCAHTEEQTVESPAIDRAVLKMRGWATLQLSERGAAGFSEQLLSISRQLGTPAGTRSGDSMCDVLVPTEINKAKPRSLSRVHGVGEFPLHTDTAHWITPCHYLLLACVSPGSGNRGTLMMDTHGLRLKKHQLSLLYSTPFRVTNGRNSFFSTVLSKTRSFVRFDPGCMTATTPDGLETLEIFSQYTWPDDVEHFQWAVGSVLLLDNWRVLHGRTKADGGDEDRMLLRISIR